MKKLVLGAVLIGICTACPKVERKVFTFDLKKNTGVLYFENVVTDSPGEADSDFMTIVEEVIQGTKLEEEYKGWRIAEKELYENEGRLDGKITFTFDDLGDAGLYKHDKKSGIVWCSSRSEDQTLVATNGKRIDDVLPGCVAWDRKATKLSVTVKTGTLMGGEQPLVDSFKRWKAGEKLERKDAGMFGDSPFGSRGMDEASMEAFGEKLASGLLGGVADGMLSDLEATSAFGPATPEDSVAEALFGEVPVNVLRMCAAVGAKKEGRSIDETLVVTLQPDGTLVAKAEGADERRNVCYGEAFDDVVKPSVETPWTGRFPIGVQLPGKLD